jgi:hypothetical protein
MKFSMDNDKIKAFAQNTLGCGCPEEVFQHIECKKNVNLDGLNILYNINIGNRLLVYVYSVDNADSMKELLPRLFDIGKRERDSAGFNRFRLVLAADDEENIRKVAEDLFRRIQTDEKIHLHILSKTGLPQF